MKLAKVELDYEYIVSRILKGIIWPDAFVNLRKNLCDLEIIEELPELDNHMSMIQKHFTDSFGNLRDNRVEKYYKGEDEPVYELMMEILSRTEALKNTYRMALKGKLQKTQMDLETQIENLQEGDVIGEYIEQAASQNMEIMYLDRIGFALELNIQNLQVIIDSYGIGFSVPKKERYNMYNDEFKMYINQLYYDGVDITSDPILSATLYQAIDAIIQFIPQDNLDPFKLDQCKNLVDILMNPDTYYEKCQREEIESEDIARMFRMAYPTYMHEFLDMYLDRYESMDGQEQVNFRKCFNLTENTGELTTLCSSYVKLGFSQQ